MEDNKKFYLTTITPSTSITDALQLQLTSTQQHLIVVKNNLIEIFELNQNGLESIYRKQLPYEIHFMTKYRQLNAEKDSVILMTSNQELMIVSLNQQKNLQLETKISVFESEIESTTKQLEEIQEELTIAISEKQIAEEKVANATRELEELQDTLEEKDLINIFNFYRMLIFQYYLFQVQKIICF